MSLFFDSSTLISMAVTCALPVFRELKKFYAGDFYITTAVYNETIKRAMDSLRFRYEGYRIKALVDEGILKIYSDAGLQSEITKLMRAINSTYLLKGRPLEIMHLGETSALMACLKEKGEAFVVDEWLARHIVEAPEQVKARLESKMHAKININRAAAAEWMAEASEKVSVLRSTELALAAWKNNLLSSNKDMFFGLLWALKFAGCAISEQEINTYLNKLT